MFKARALHYVLKIGDRARNIDFFKNVLGMQVLRHEEFTEGCDAQCNGPYDNRWSKTMIGYGPESNHFVIELTYNYGVQSYELGNDLGGITIKNNRIVGRAKDLKYPVEEQGNGRFLLTAPDGYKFFVINEEDLQNDPVKEVILNCTDLKKSVDYWNGTLKMNLLDNTHKAASLSYGSDFSLRLSQLDEPLSRAKAYGRVAFALPYDDQPKIDEVIKSINGTILTPLITLDTPGKATVRVLILADPDGHEICFVDEEGFTQLSQMDPKSPEMLEKYIQKDPFQKTAD